MLGRSTRLMLNRVVFVLVVDEKFPPGFDERPSLRFLERSSLYANVFF